MCKSLDTLPIQHVLHTYFKILTQFVYLVLFEGSHNLALKM